MAHIPHRMIDKETNQEIKTINYLEEILLQYEIGDYLIGQENEGYEHFHFVVQMTEKDYHKYAKRVFKDRFNLHGRWVRDPDGTTHPRQYGKLKKIHDITKMKAYTLKDGNFKTNMPINKINELIQVAKENTRETTITERVCEYLNKTVKPHMGEYQLQRQVVRYFLKNQETKVNLTKNKINNYLTYYKLYYKKKDLKTIDEDISSILSTLGITEYY